MHKNAIRTLNILAEKDNANDDMMVEMNLNTFQTYVERKATFPILFYSTTCSHCAVAKTVIGNYLKDHHDLVYKLEIDTYVLDILSTLYPNDFSMETTVPNLYIYDAGKITYKFNQGNLLRERAFTNEANRLFNHSNISFGKEESAVKNYLSTCSEIMFFGYSSSNKETVQYFAQNIYPERSNLEAKTLVVDYDKISSTTGEYLYTYFGITEETKYSVVTIDESGSKQSIQYLSK